MYNKLALFATSTVLFAGSSFAAELGVTNSYGHSFRNGTGTTNIEFQTNSQLVEKSVYGAVKLETSSYGGNETTTTGLGDGNGNGNGNGNSPNVPDTGNYSDNAFALSFGLGTRNYTENTTVTGSTVETYSFGSTNFTHSVGVFSRWVARGR